MTRAALSEDQQAVLAVLNAAAGALTVAEVAQLLGPGKHPAGTGRTLGALHRRGLVGHVLLGRRIVFYPAEGNRP